MRPILFPALLLAAATLPASAQISRAPREPREPGTRVFSIPRLEAARAPRAVLGIATSASWSARDTAGVLVASVTEGSPAAKAGIEEGARLQAINGISLRVSAADAEDPALAGIGSRRLTRELDKHKPGDEVELRVASGSQARTVRVRLADPDSLYRRGVAAGGRGAGGVLRESFSAPRASLGISVGSTGSRRDTLGVFVMGADDEGPAAKAGVVEGARIAAINGKDLRVSRDDIEDGMVASARVQRLMRELGDVKPGDEVELRVWQNGQYRTQRVRTVPADSLRRNRRTMIIGDRFGPGMFFGPEGFGPGRIEIERSMPRVRVLPRGEGGPIRMEIEPRILEELDVILDGAMRGARGAVEGARASLRARGPVVYH